MTRKKKLTVEGEPKIVAEIREKILSSFKDLTFDEKPHKYFLNGAELPSVSSVIHRFQEQTDFNEVAVGYAKKNGYTPQYWLDKWKFNNLIATTTGSRVHEFGESVGWLRNGHPELITEHNKCNYDEERGWLIPTRPKEEAVLKFYDEFPKNLHFVLAETMVYANKTDDEKYRVVNQFAGTFDLLAYYQDPEDDEKSGLVILDWKTNKSLLDDYSRNNDKRLLPPFQYMYDENLSIYTLQLSLYALCLRNIGLDIKACRLIWLKEDGTYELVKIRDLSKEEWFIKTF
jgi:hypothetical protein